MNKFVLLSLALMLSASATFAEVQSFDDVGLTVDVPAGWKHSKGEGSYTVDAPEGMSIVFVALPDKDQAKAIATIEGALDAKVGTVKWEDKPDKEPINGMQAETWEGTAKDGALQVEAIYLEVGDKTVGIYWFDTKETEAKYKAQIDQIMKGLKKK